MPEAHYRRVSAYVDATDLRGRLVYCRVDERRQPAPPEQSDDAALRDKLEIKPDTPFYDWLSADLAAHYDYVCCETMEQFQRERRALTINGQIKRGGALHEKDDRHPLGDRKRYVLGWDNRAKIAVLAAELEARGQELAAVRATIAANQDEQRQYRARQQLLRDLLGFERFAAIDWRAEERMLGELETQHRELAASADHLQHLREQLAALEDRIRAAEEEKAEALAGHRDARGRPAALRAPAPRV